MNVQHLKTWVACALSVACGLAHADISYTFDHDAEGFTVNEPAGTLTYEAGGYLLVNDTDGNTDVLLQFPNAALATGWSPYLGGTLSFDAALAQPISDYWPSFGTVTLTSAQGSLAVDIAPAGEPGTSWKTYSVKLDPASWSTTAAQLGLVLATLQKVDISMEAGNGPIEVIKVDNIRVSAAVPEASTTVMMALGLGWMGLLGMRGRRP